MTQSSDKTRPTPESGFEFPGFKMPEFNSDLFPNYSQAHRAFLENAVAINQEMMRFAQERLQADAQLLQELPKCTNWEQTTTVQSDFARAASDAYMREMPKLMSMWTALFETTARESQAKS